MERVESRVEVVAFLRDDASPNAVELARRDIAAFPEVLSACIALQAPRGGAVFGIDEDTAVVGRDGAWQVHGAGRVTVWHGRRRARYRKGEAFRA